jgi:hypothetical protein
MSVYIRVHLVLTCRQYTPFYILEQISSIEKRKKKLVHDKDKAMSSFLSLSNNIYDWSWWHSWNIEEIDDNSLYIYIYPSYSCLLLFV